jgi:hypothetical protein
MDDKVAPAVAESLIKARRVKVEFIKGGISFSLRKETKKAPACRKGSRPPWLRWRENRQKAHLAPVASSRCLLGGWIRIVAGLGISLTMFPVHPEG